MARKVEIDIVGDAKGFVKETERATKASQTMASKMKSSVMQGLGLGAGFGIYGLLTKGIGMVTDALKGAVEAAIEDERSQAQLNRTLANNVQNWGAYGDAIQQATEEALALAFADDEVRASLNALIPRTKDVNEAIRLNALAMDLARAKGMSLEQAAGLVGKAYSGQVTALRRAGLAIDSNLSSTEALDELQRQVAGQAETYAGTAEGAYKTLNLTIDELAESIGKELLPYLKDFAGYLRSDVIPNIDDLIHGLKDAASWTAILAATARMDFGTVVRELAKLTDTETRTFNVPAPGEIKFFDPIPKAAEEATDEGIRVMRRFVSVTPELMRHAVVDMKQAIKQGKAGIIEQFRDLAWQSKHPFAEKNYADWLHDKETQALRKMRQANRRGMPAIEAQYRQLAADIRAEYQGLPGYMRSIAAQAMAALSIIPGLGGLDDWFDWGNDSGGGGGGGSGKKKRKKRRRPSGDGGSPHQPPTGEDFMSLTGPGPTSKSSGGVTINVYAATGDPVAIGASLTKALRAYRNAGGGPALRAAVG